MFERVEAALRIISSFSGLAQENMTRLAGWRFLELGRRIERAVDTCRFINQFAGDRGPDAALDVLLELCDSQITYRQRYVMIAARAPVIDLVVLDPNNPRSVAYQFDRIEEHLAALPKHAARRPPVAGRSRSPPPRRPRCTPRDAADVDEAADRPYRRCRAAAVRHRSLRRI